MNINLGLRTLALLAFVAASTIVIVMPEFIGGTHPAQPFNAVVAVGLN
jgi:hypothetical protein